MEPVSEPEGVAQIRRSVTMGPGGARLTEPIVPVVERREAKEYGRFKRGGDGSSRWLSEYEQDEQISVSLDVSLSLMLWAVILGNVGITTTWLAWFNGDLLFVPGSISQMVHRKDSAERDLFMIFAVAGMLLIMSQFSLRLSHTMLPTTDADGKSHLLPEILNLMRFAGTGTGAMLVAMVPTSVGEPGVRTHVHLLCAGLLFLGGIVPEAVLLWDHPLVSRTDKETRPEWIVRFLHWLFAFLCFFMFFATELLQIFGLDPQQGHEEGDTGAAYVCWQFKTAQMLSEVLGGAGLFQMHVAYWVFADERTAKFVPKASWVVGLGSIVVIVNYAVLSGFHCERVGRLSPEIMAYRDNCAEEAELACILCKPGVKLAPLRTARMIEAGAAIKHDGPMECSELHVNRLEWTLSVLPHIIHQAEHGLQVAYTADPVKAISSALLRYSVCAEGKEYSGLYIPDVNKLGIPELSHLTTKRNPIDTRRDPHARAVMTVACRLDSVPAGGAGKALQLRVAAEKGADAGATKGALHSSWTCVTPSVDIDRDKGMNATLLNGVSSPNFGESRHELVSDLAALLWQRQIIDWTQQSLDSGGFDPAMPIPTLADIPDGMQTASLSTLLLSEELFVLRTDVNERMRCDEKHWPGASDAEPMRPHVTIRQIQRIATMSVQALAEQQADCKQRGLCEKLGESCGANGPGGVCMLVNAEEPRCQVESFEEVPDGKEECAASQLCCRPSDAGIMARVIATRVSAPVSPAPAPADPVGAANLEKESESRGRAGAAVVEADGSWTRAAPAGGHLPMRAEEARVSTPLVEASDRDGWRDELRDRDPGSDLIVAE